MSKEIQFILTGINTLEFATIESNLNELFKEAGLNTTIDFAIDEENTAIECILKFELLLDDNPIIIISVSCEFDIEENTWEQFKNAKKTVLNVPKGFIQHLAMITVGTARGVLHAKTENTPFNQYFLPQLNVAEMLDKNLKIDLD